MHRQSKWPGADALLAFLLPVRRRTWKSSRCPKREDSSGHPTPNTHAPVGDFPSTHQRPACTSSEMGSMDPYSMAAALADATRRLKCSHAVSGRHSAPPHISMASSSHIVLDAGRDVEQSKPAHQAARSLPSVDSRPSSDVGSSSSSAVSLASYKQGNAKPSSGPGRGEFMT